MFRSLVVLLSLLFISCATSYQKTGFSGGYSEKEIKKDLWKVTFGGNGFTTKDSAQTYWLYRASELTIEKGYDYFEIQNTWIGGIPLWKENLNFIMVAQVIYIPMADVYKPVVELDIKLYKKPFRPKAPKSFDAKKLLSTLDPYVKGKKCSDNNVCAHEKTYLK